MTLNFSTLVNNKTSFTPGQETKLFVSTAYTRGSTIPTKSLTLAASAGVGSGATATLTVVGGAITDIQITAGGTGYIDGATTISFSIGTGASADLIVIDGIVSGYANLVGGTGYTSSSTATITGFTDVTGAIAIDDEAIGLSAATTFDLYEGTRIEFKVFGASKPVYVREFTPAGATAIPIVPSLYAVPAASVATVYAWVPIFSVNQVNLDNSATVIAEQVFSAGLETQKAVTQLDRKASAQGIQVHGDPGLTVLFGANELGQLVTLEVVKPYQRGVVRGQAITGGLPENIQKNQFIQQTINLEFSGSTTRYEY